MIASVLPISCAGLSGCPCTFLCCCDCSSQSVLVALAGKQGDCGECGWLIFLLSFSAFLRFQSLRSAFLGDVLHLAARAPVSARSSGIVMDATGCCNWEPFSQDAEFAKSGGFDPVHKP